MLLIAFYISNEFKKFPPQGNGNKFNTYQGDRFDAEAPRHVQQPEPNTNEVL